MKKNFRKIFILGLGMIFFSCLTFAEDGEDYFWIFNQEGNFLGWKPRNFSSLEATKSSLVGITSFDPGLLSPVLNLDASYYGILEFRDPSNFHDFWRYN